MSLQLARTDALALIGGVFAAALAGLLLMFLFATPTISDAILVERVVSVLTAIVAVFSIYAAIKTAQNWGGELGRALQILGVGCVLAILVYLPHLHWLLASITAGAPATWLTIDGMWWLTFFHLLTTLSFLFIGYGFYRIYTLIKPEIGTLE